MDVPASVVFQSTHPSGVRPYGLRQKSGNNQFQSTHPSGVRRVRLTCLTNLDHFNPRTPVGCDIRRWYSGLDSLHFNPRTPVGCDKPDELVLFCSPISIHAPQWGATFILVILPVLVVNFNPRTPVGCDSLTGARLVHRHISIHAPQWGATARMGIAFHNMEAPSVLKTDFIAKIHVHRSIHKFSNQKHQQTIHF